MNVPSNDAGLVMIWSIQPFCEWLVSLNGQIATCVESAEMMVDNIVTRGAIPVSASEDTALAQDLISRNQASANGATDYMAASQQMTRLGIPNTPYGSDWFAANDFVPVVKASIDRGIPVLFGIYAAHNLYDDWTQQSEDGGVNGHGITICGYDSTGAICADPNTVQARDGNLVHYSWDDLRSAFGGYPSMVVPEVIMGTVLDGDFNITTGSDGKPVYALKKNPAITFGGGAAELYIKLNGSIGLPVAEVDYTMQGQFYKGFCFQRFERGIMVYDPQHKLDTVPGMGDFYLAHIDSGVFAAAPSDDEASEDAATAALQAQVASLQAQLAAAQSKPGVPSDAHDILANVVNVLGPMADSVVRARSLMKEMGF